MGEKRALIFYSIRNTGHHSAAKALAKAFAIVDGEIDVSVMNLVAYTHPIMERLISNLFVQVMKRRPKIWGNLYNSPRNEERFVQFTDMVLRRGIDRVDALVEERLPGAIVCTQCLPCNMVDEYKQKSGSTVPLVAVITDFFIPYYWICPNVDMYVIPHESLAADMVGFGVDPEKIAPLGIPIDPDYSRSTGGDEVGTRLGLDRKRPVVVVMGGGSGIGPLHDIARLFMEGGSDVQVIVIAGRNQALKQKLRKEKQKLGAGHVTVLSYVKRLNELMEVADLIITKPGGLTLAESMAKGLPVIAVSALPGQEEKNMEYLADNGIGYRAGGPAEAVALARDLLHDRSRLSLSKQKARAMGKPNSAVDAASAIAQLTNAPVPSL